MCVFVVRNVSSTFQMRNVLLCLRPAAAQAHTKAAFVFRLHPQPRLPALQHQQNIGHNQNAQASQVEGWMQ